MTAPKNTTPGPWRHSNWGGDVMAGEKTIACLCWATRPDDYEAARADATLIAAVHELHAAAEMAREAIAALAKSTISPDHARQGERAMAEIDAALAKARGER